MLKKIIFIPLLILTAGFLAHIGYYCFFPDVSELRRVNPKKTAFMEFREEQWQQAGKRRRSASSGCP
jgi:monofunctional glycosyltransferase